MVSLLNLNREINEIRGSISIKQVSSTANFKLQLLQNVHFADTNKISILLQIVSILYDIE